MRLQTLLMAEVRGLADVVVAEFMDEAILREVLGSTDLHYDPLLVDQREKLCRSLKDARALIVRNRTQVDRELLEHAPELKVIGRLGVGLDNIDLDACSGRNVIVCPATGANDLAVAEYAIMAGLNLMRRAWMSSERTIAGEWPRTEFIGREISGKRLGLVGFGAIGRRVGQLGKALGMGVAAFDPYLGVNNRAWKQAERITLEEIACECDVVSIHVPLTDETHHIVGKQFISQMRSKTVLINTSRGGVVDESALIAALQNGHIGGAALDVFESEPVDAQSGHRFAGVPNLLLSPHIGGITEESNVRVSRVTAENVAKHLRL